MKDTQRILASYITPLIKTVELQESHVLCGSNERIYRDPEGIEWED